MNRNSLSKLHFSWIASVTLMSGALLAGCDTAQPPAFRLNMVEAVVQDASPEYQQEIADVLGAMFGTPDEPFALAETGLDQSKLDMAAGPAWSDVKGSNFGLYRRHCVHCHGITGDGHGPTARFLNPYPRDYRQGTYKFKSTLNPAQPTDEDLRRVLMNGVPGTAMPSFSLLPGSEVEALVEYVKYLSIRGQMETALHQIVYELEEEEVVDENGAQVLDDEGEPLLKRTPLAPATYPEQRDEVMDYLVEIMAGWEAAGEQIIVPREDEIPADERSPEEVLASIDAGRELFYGKADCKKCHGPTGLGDGQQTDHDNWNKAHKKFLDDIVLKSESIDKRVTAGELSEADQQRLNSDRVELGKWQEVAQTLYVPRNAIPRNLRQGIYRGGRRRVDIFHRIYTGIAGTPMPAIGPATLDPEAKGTLTETEMWQIVDYVLSLPYEAPSRPLKALPLNVSEVAN